MTNHVEELDRDACLEMLRSQRVGRIAVTHQALPAIIPVNYVLDGHALVFRTRGDGVLGRACRSTVVAFEVDDIAEDGLSGSSVLVVGVADVLDDSERLRAIHLGLASAVAESADQFVRVTLGKVSGRRVHATVAAEVSA